MLSLGFIRFSSLLSTGFFSIDVSVQTLLLDAAPVNKRTVVYRGGGGGDSPRVALSKGRHSPKGGGRKGKKGKIHGK